MPERITHIALDDIITKPDVADLLGVSPQHISVMLSRGTDGIPAPILTTRQGSIFSKTEILRWARSCGRLKVDAP